MKLEVFYIQLPLIILLYAQSPIDPSTMQSPFVWSKKGEGWETWYKREQTITY